MNGKIIDHKQGEAAFERDQENLEEMVAQRTQELQKEIANLKQQTRQRAGAPGTMELPDELFRDQARRRVALGLVMAEVVKRHSIKADPQRVREVVENVAASYEKPEEVIAYYYGNKEQLASFESVALEDEVVKWVLDRVQVEDEPSSFEELTRPQS